GARPPRIAVCGSGLLADFFEGSLAPIYEQEVRDRIVGNEQVHAAIIIYIGGNDSPTLAQMSCDAGGSGNVGKGSVAVVMKEPTGRGFVKVRDAVSDFVVGGAGQVLGFVEIDKAANKQIKAPVIVVIKPNGAGRPSRRGDAGLFGDVGESAISVVVIENASPVLGDVDVGRS